MKSISQKNVLTGCIILLSVAPLLAQDWPQWRGANRDGKADGFTTPQAWPKELTQKWKTVVGLGDATPALVGNRIYVFARQGDNEVTLCLDAENGKELWRDAYPAQAATGPAGRHPGPRSSPAAAEGKVVTLGVAGVLSCVDTATGKVIWRKDEYKEVPQFFTSMSPVITDGMAIAHLGGKDTGSIVSFDLATGETKWKWEGDGPSYASPVLMSAGDTKQIVVQTEKNLVSLALTDGNLLWQIPSIPKERFYNSASPIVDGPMIIYTGQGEGTKAAKIEKQEGEFSPKEIWNNKTIGTGFNTPVLKDGLLFGISDKGNLFCLNAQTGQEAWTGTNPIDRFAEILDAGPVLMVLSSKSELIVFQPDSTKYIEIARYKVSETPVYAYPIISGNRLLVKDQESLTLWMIP